jgi:serine/threonine protein kinase
MSDDSEDGAGPHDRDYDSFFLHHLQSVHGNAAWYLNHRFVGKGGNGTTFFVTCTSGTHNGFQFALKVFHKISDEKRQARFLDEIRHYKALSHPSIIKVYDEGTYTAGERSYPFAVMDFIPENLEQKLGRGLPQVSRIQTLRYTQNIVSGIAYLHSQAQPIVHRDIKPANILINGPTARLGDLGLAKVLMEGGDDNAEDVAAYIAMPRFYRTPELVRIASGEKINLTPASDIYQIGLVLYRCITGFNPQKPFDDDFTEPIELDVRQIQGAGGPRLEALLARMLSEDPADRLSATLVLSRLNQIHKEVCQADLSATGITR